MASLFGLIKKIFGSAPKGETDVEQASYVPASKTGIERATEAEELASHVEPDVSDKIDAASETLSETVTHVAEVAAAKVADVANSDIVHEAETVVIAAAGALGGASGAVTEAVTEAVTSAVFGDETEEAPELPPLKLVEPVEYLDRDNFNLPRSNVVIKAIEFIDSTVGKDATARGMRVFEYGIAAAQSYDMRVDRELLLLGSLLGEVPEGAPVKAEAFLLEHGMWAALAKKVSSAIANRSDGLGSNDVETRALALGVKAELAQGDIDYVHAATAADTRNRNAA